MYNPESDQSLEPQDGDLVASKGLPSLQATITRADGTVEEVSLEDLKITRYQPE